MTDIGSGRASLPRPACLSCLTIPIIFALLKPLACVLRQRLRSPHSMATRPKLPLSYTMRDAFLSSNAPFTTFLADDGCGGCRD